MDSVTGIYSAVDPVGSVERVLCCKTDHRNREKINITMTHKPNPPEQIQQAFDTLCNENSPIAFLAITIGEDMMVNFASYGVDSQGAVELLEHMLEFIRNKQEQQAEDEYGRDNNTKMH